MPFTGFPKGATEFLSEIISNNDKEWFEANKERYQELILSPSKAFVEEMGEYLHMLSPTIHAESKVNRSLFRIYRDSRFHRDRPIKERIGIIFWQGAGHRMSSSSFYFHFDTHEMLVAAGIRVFKPPMLSTYRDYIQDQQKREELDEILTRLQKLGYIMPEPRYKRLPREFAPNMSHPELAKLGGVFVRKPMPIDESFYSAALIDKLFTHYKEFHELQQWVYHMTLHSS